MRIKDVDISGEVKSGFEAVAREATELVRLVTRRTAVSEDDGGDVGPQR